MAQFWDIIKNIIFRAFFTLFALFWANENLPEKSSSITFEYLWSPNFRKKKSEKTNGTILVNYQKCHF